MTTIYATEDVVIADLVATESPYNADPTGKTDSTSAINRALSACALAGGGTVFLPAGKYKVTSSIKIPAFVSLRGDWQDPDKGNDYGTIILADVESKDAALPALFDIGGSAGVVGLTVYYPNQSIDHVKPYPFTFYVRGQGDGYMLQSVQNCTVINGYRGVGACVDETNAHEMMTIDTLKGTFLYRGAEAYNQADVGTWKNLKFSGKYWAEAGAGLAAADRNKIDAYTKANAEGLALGDLEWTQFAGLEVENFKVGIHIVKGKRIQFAGSLTDICVTKCETGLLVDDLDPRWGMLIARSRIEGREASVVNNTGGLVKMANVSLSGSTTGSISKESADLSGYAVDLNHAPAKPKAVLYTVAVTSTDKLGNTDISDLLQKTLDSAGAAGGGVVYLPAGRYRLDKPIVVPAGVELRGCSSVAQREQGGSSKGTLILAYWGREAANPETAQAQITLAGENAGIRGVRFLYPENGVTGGIVPYSFTIRGKAAGVYAVNVAISGGYYGIDFRGCDNHFIKKFVSCCYRNAITAGGKNGLIEGCLMNPNMLYRDGVSFAGWPTNESTVFTETINPITRRNTDYICLENAVGQRVLNCFAYGVKQMIVSTNSTDVLLLNIGADNIGDGQPLLHVMGGNVTAINMMRYNGRSYQVSNASIRLYNRLSIGDKTEATFVG